MENEPQKPSEPEIKEVDNFNWLVPQCCREGWDSCTHVVKKQGKIKRNVGL